MLNFGVIESGALYRSLQMRACKQSKTGWCTLYDVGVYCLTYEEHTLEQTYLIERLYDIMLRGEKKNMKYGVCLWMLSLPLKEAIPLLHNLGFDSCAIGTDAFKDNNVDEIKKLLEDYQIEVASIGVNELCKVGMSRVQNEKKVTKILQEALDLTVYLKSPVLQIPSFVDGAINTQDELEQTAKCLYEICKKAQPFDIKIGHESVLTVEQNRYVEEKAGENLFLYYDATNLLNSKTEDPVRLMNDLYQKICQVHVKDKRNGSKDFVAIGQGDRQVKEICEKLMEFGYDGAVLLESNYQVCKDLQADLKRDLDLLKGYMKR